MKFSYKFIDGGKTILLILLLNVLAGKLHAQLNPYGAGYFQNQYLFNPAMAGYQQKLNVNLAYRKEWVDIPDGPVNQYLTGDYGLSDRVGARLKITNDKAGVLSTTEAMATYSYHIAVSDNQNLHFGLSAGVWNRRVDNSRLNGEPGDASVMSAGRTQFDADFGVAYNYDRLTVQGAFPNMVSYFQKNETDAVDKPTFFAAASYKVNVSNNEDITLEPKVAYRGVKGYDQIVDVGANVDFSNRVNVFGVYHTTKNITAGAGLNLFNKLAITANYTSASSVLKTYTDGTIEIGLRFSFLEKTK